MSVVSPLTSISRRGLLAALAATAALPACGGAPAVSVPARPRPPGPAGAGVEDLVAGARLGGAVSLLVVERASGAVLESRDAARPLPPASLAKTITALYAIDTLGARYRFSTRLIATGPVRAGRVEGDLILAGGGDPVLDTDALAAMAAQLKAQGVRAIAGAFRVWGGALPSIEQIEPGQPAHLGYNAAVSGLNLNFNRVNFAWRRTGGALRVTMDAPGARTNAPVAMARVRVVDRDRPLFAYAAGENVDNWTVAARALGASGSRWLPVRHPAAYAGEVFRALAAQSGVTLPAPMAMAAVPQGTVLVEHQSEELAPILRDMLRHSNNLIAEVAGLTASAARGPGATTLAQSGARMTAWARARYGVEGALGDHSGLGSHSRLTANDLVRVLAPQGPLPGLMKPFAAPSGQPPLPAPVVAKTGTLNFVSALAGYVTPPGGRALCFAILTGDPDRRDAVPAEAREAPPGAREWDMASRNLQRALLARWTRLYG